MSRISQARRRAGLISKAKRLASHPPEPESNGSTISYWKTIVLNGKMTRILVTGEKKKLMVQDAIIESLLDDIQIRTLEMK